MQVFAGGANVAQRGKASQSTTDFGGEAVRAIDGRTLGDYTKNSVTHTAISDDPWWEVDLGSMQAIDRVVFFNRTDGGIQSRLNGVKVTLLDAERKPVHEQTIAEAPKESKALDISGVTPLKLAAAYADFEQTDFHAASVIDADKASAGRLVDKLIKNICSRSCRRIRSSCSKEASCVLNWLTNRRIGTICLPALTCL